MLQRLQTISERRNPTNSSEQERRLDRWEDVTFRYGGIYFGEYGGIYFGEKRMHCECPQTEYHGKQVRYLESCTRSGRSRSIELQSEEGHHSIQSSSKYVKLAVVIQNRPSIPTGKKVNMRKVSPTIRKRKRTNRPRAKLPRVR